MAKAHRKAKFYYNDGICEEHDIVLPEDPRVIKVIKLLGELGWLSDTGFGNTTIYYEEGSFTHVSFKTTLKGPRTTT